MLQSFNYHRQYDWMTVCKINTENGLVCFNHLITTDNMIG